MAEYDKVPRLGTLEADAEELRKYARAPEPLSAMFNRPSVTPPSLPPVELSDYQPTATITPLNPVTTPTLRDEILQTLEQLVADIKSEKVSPLHLILSYGDDRPDAVAYYWSGIGLGRFEMIGHLHAEATALATDEYDE